MAPVDPFYFSPAAIWFDLQGTLTAAYLQNSNAQIEIDTIQLKPSISISTVSITPNPVSIPYISSLNSAYDPINMRLLLLITDGNFIRTPILLDIKARTASAPQSTTNSDLPVFSTTLKSFIAFHDISFSQLDRFPPTYDTSKMFANISPLHGIDGTKLCVDDNLGKIYFPWQIQGPPVKYGWATVDISNGSFTTVNNSWDNPFFGDYWLCPTGS
jgi:hypothetical protein